MQTHSDIESKDNLSIPQFLYKYRSLGDFTNKILCDNELYYSRPNRFNDPFDCQLISENKFSRKMIQDFLRKNILNINRQDLRNKAIYYDKNPSIFKKLVTDALEKSSLNSGVSCFAGSNDNILMWSHYANSHNGICIKFDILESIELFLLPIEVKYTDNYPVYNHLKNNKNLIEFMFQTKAKCWEYENELRIIKNNSGNYKFNKSSIIEISFGCNVSTLDIEKYKQLILDNNFTNATFKKAIPSKKEFKLEIVDL